MGELSNDLDTLKQWRDNNTRKSREVVDIWVRSVKNSISSLGKEKHMILEQVCIAALDCYELAIAQKCVQALYKDFPNSLRVKKLEAMCLEADEKYEDALTILNSIVAQDETYSAAKKRRVAILRALDCNAEAIKELNDYLKIHMIDVEAWQELSELYMIENDFQKAAFCVEELILFSPHNHLLHQRYADIKYTVGGLENFELARSYYCQALKLNPKNIRALYGLYLATTAIGNSSKCPPQKKKEAAKLAEWSLKEIRNQYEEVEMEDVDKCLAALEI